MHICDRSPEHQQDMRNPTNKNDADAKLMDLFQKDEAAEVIFVRTMLVPVELRKYVETCLLNFIKHNASKASKY